MLSVEGLTKLHTNTTDDVAGGIREATFTLQPGAFFTLLGPSGCGKTTTLRCIAGLEKPDAGVLRMGDKLLFHSDDGVSVPMNRRGIGMVFQSYAIWPHMTVFENVAFPLSVSKDRQYSSAETQDCVTRALRTVDLNGYQNRPATRLSGGEQQRVALARAIVHEPQLLLLDEPLSNLDAHLREEMRVELKRLQRQTGITTVYVTHDQAEALSLSDRIAVIEKGRIVQLGTPEEIYFKPNTPFVAGFVGATNLVEGTAKSAADRDRLVTVTLDTGETIHCHTVAAMPACARVVVSIRPENATIERTDAQDRNIGQAESILHGRIDHTSFQGQTRRYDVELNGWRMHVLTSPEIRLKPGEAVVLRLAAQNITAVPKN